MRFRLSSIAALALAAALAAGACGGGSGASAPTEDASRAPTTIRVGYFPNVTHATALVGVEGGILARALGADKLVTTTFNAGPAAIEAIFSGALDATYIGPNPAINAFVKSKGEAIRIVAGATSGGAALVARPGITSAVDLRGKKVASPQVGGTQDVALRSWLRDAELKTDFQGGGDVSVVAQENAQTLETFKSGQIAGAWVPEPWATRMVLEGGGKVLVDERTLWPGGRFVTTHLIVRTKFLREHPSTIRRLLQGHLEADDLVNSKPSSAKKLANAGIEKLTGKRLAEEVVEAAWKNLTFTVDPVASSLRVAAQHAEAVGLLPTVDLDGIYDLTILNELLEAAKLDAVASS